MRLIKIVLLFLIVQESLANDKLNRIALILPDSYFQLGDQVSLEAENILMNYNLKAEINCFYYSELNTLKSNSLSQYQLIFVDVLNQQKVSPIMPVLNSLGYKGVSVFAIGSANFWGSAQYPDIKIDKEPIAFYEQSGKSNLVSMILNQSRKTYNLNELPVQSLIVIPEYSLCNMETGEIYSEFEAYRNNYENYQKNNPWVALQIWRSDFLSGQDKHIKPYINLFEDNGFNTLCFYGHPTKKYVTNLFYDSANVLVPDIILSQSIWLGANPQKEREMFETLNIPVINLVQVNQSKDEWLNNPKGIQIYNRTNALCLPEQMGLIQSVVTVCKEIHDTISNLDEKTAIRFQLKNLLSKVQKLYILQNKPNNEKKVALIYYSHPPGKELLGASYLNVVPNSLYTIINRLKKEGYYLDDTQITKSKIFEDVSNHGINIGNWAPDEINKLVEKGQAMLIPMQLYEQWYATLSTNLRLSIEKQWGIPEQCNIMVWTDSKNEKYFVIPQVKYGNILLTPQPVRGWSQDLDVMHHDISVPPHHQYIAFYLYLQNSFQADAVVHFGTHSTLEWLPGKETGLNKNDVSEALIGDLVNIYPYIVDDVGEGLQAKRRSGAIIIDHMTPPFDRININPELKRLENLISEYEIAESKSTALAQIKLQEINHLSKKSGILDEIGIDSIKNHAQLHYLEHYIEEIREQFTPLGLHTFGELPTDENIEKNVEAIVSQNTQVNKNNLKAYKNEIRKRIIQSASAELNAVVDALNGKYIKASTGNDPIRNPASLPTGKNFYAFDADYLPSIEIYKQGEILAYDLIEKYKQENNDEFPSKLTFILWSTECIRNEGIMEAQILSLLGVQPIYDGYGKVVDLKVISQKQLKRPRIDVVIIPSGLYRDIFPQLILLLDKAVKLAAQQKEVDNYVRLNSLDYFRYMKEMNLPDSIAEELSMTRIFSTPDGEYGTGTNTVVEASGSWESDKAIADVFINRMHFPYSETFWGLANVSDSILKSLYKRQLSGTKVVLHSRTSHLYASLDNDDFFQYLGGAALAIRSIDSIAPNVMVSNLTQKGNLTHEKLEYFISKEMHSRYLNPVWIESMLNEGYSGSRFIRQVSSNLWGWQVTVPDAIDESKWLNFYSTYIKDKHNLNIEDKFIKSDNLFAYQVIISRLMEVIRKDYWNPQDEIRANLLNKFFMTVDKVGLSCNLNVCNNEFLIEFIDAEAKRIKGVNSKGLRQYKKALKQIRRQGVLHSIPSDGQVATNEKKSNKYIPKKTVKGYQVEKVGQKKTANDKNKVNPQWLLFVAIGLYTGYYFIKKYKSKTKNRKK